MSAASGRSSTTARIAKAIRAAQKTLGTGAFNVVSIGFNLPFDSPPAMRDFARRYGISDPHWEFLTPYQKQLADLTAQLGFQYVPTLAGFDHVTQLTILDAQGRVVTAGGRVLTVCALGTDIATARENAYAAVEKIRFDGAFCRRDIAHRALHRS